MTDDWNYKLGVSQGGMDVDKIEELSNRYDEHVQTELSGEVGTNHILRDFKRRF